MGVKKVIKISLFGNKSKQQECIEELQKLELLEIILPKNQFSKKLAIEKTVNQLEIVLSFLSSDFKESFMGKNGIHYVSENEFFMTEKNNLNQNVALIENLYEKIMQIAQLKKEEIELQNKYHLYEHWKNFHYTNHQLKSLNQVGVVLGCMKTEALKQFQETEDLYDYDIIHQIANMSYCCFIIYKPDFNRIVDLLKESGFQEIDTDSENSEISLKSIYENTNNQLKKVQNDLVLTQKEVEKYQKSMKKLRLTYDYLSSKLLLDEANIGIQETEYLFIADCWIAEEDLPLLEDFMKKISDCDFEKQVITEEDEVPVLIRNNRGSQAFEFVTEMYSMPGKNDPDPTPYFAPFFPLFMGMCIGDAGPGLLLILMSLFCLKKINLSASMRKLMQICLRGGIWAIVFGILTGTYFAIPLNLPYLYEPSKNILFALGLSILLGYIHILVAFFVKFFYLWSHGNKLSAVYDGLSKIFVMLGGGLFVLGYAIHSATMEAIGGYLALVGVVIIFLTAGRHEGETTLSKLIWGGYGVYELSGLFGDLLSYARLFALGLSGGIIANAINTLTPNIIHGITFDSFAHGIKAIILICVFVLILVFGHLFVMALGVMSGFIHTMRLQFVEFFSKFFTGGSVSFNPLKIKTKYFWVKK